MTHTSSPSGSLSGSLSADGSARWEDTADERSAYVRALCEHHAAPLVVMACVLIDDVDLAADIVAATLAAACRDERPVTPADHETRTHLARSVYHRCVGRLAAMERYPQLRRTNGQSRGAAKPFSHLPVQQRALMALALFGGHDVAQIARTLGVSTMAIVDELPQALLSIEVAANSSRR